MTMNILHTNFHRGWGGQSNRILTECRGLVERGHRVALAVPPGSGLAQRAPAAGIEVLDDFNFARGLRPHKLIPDLRKLRALVNERRFDIIHTHGSQDAWAVAFALAGMPRRPVVLRTRHNIFPVKDHAANRWLYGTVFDGIVCISGAILEDCAAKPYLRRQNLALIHSAVKLERFQGLTREARPELDPAGTHFLAGMTGRLCVEKGHRHLIDALPLIIKDAPDFLLAIIGAGGLKDELESQVRALGVGAHVNFTGFRDDIPRLLGALDLFIMPSISEGLGTSIIEAASAGLPIVATNVGGVPDVIETGVAGLLVPAADPAALAAAVVRLYRDRALAAQYAAAARAHAIATFSEEALVEKTEALYLEWIARGPRNAAAIRTPEPAHP